MWFEVSQQTLWDALHHIVSAVASPALQPIQACIRLQADSRGVTLLACNNVMMMQYEIPCGAGLLRVHRYGGAVVPARYFLDIVRHMPTGILILQSEEKMEVNIRSDSTKYCLRGMEADLFPKLLKFDRSGRMFRVRNDEIKSVVQQVSFAASISESRPVLTGISCSFVGERVRMIASDGIRLASRELKMSSERNAPASYAIIPGKSLLQFTKLLSDLQSETFVAIESGHIQLKTDRFIMQSALIEGNYPSVERLIPDTFSTTLSVNTIQLLHTIERMILVAGTENVVHMHIRTNSIHMQSGKAEIGHVSEEIQLDRVSGDPLSIVFNGKYLAEILRNVADERIIMRFNGKWKPFVIAPLNSPSSLYILTPIRSHS